MSIFAHGMGAPLPRGQRQGFLIDNFEDGNFTFHPLWWKFGNISVEVVNNKDFRDGDIFVSRDIGNKSLLIESKNKTEWYAGGMGANVNKSQQDLSQYSNFQIDVCGFGPGEGNLKIELFDDDNHNFIIERGNKEPYDPIRDDRFIYNVPIDWYGWKRIAIPLINFIDDNPKVGNDLLDIELYGGSGGLLQVNLIGLTSTKIGVFRCLVDNIKLMR